MIVRRPLACLVLLALGLLASLAVGCGGDEDQRGLLSERRASSLRDDLDKIADYVSEGRCDAARDRLDSLRIKVGDLPQRTEPELRERLTDGVVHLERISPEECEGNKKEPKTTEPAETVPETTPETTPPPVETEPPPVETEPPPVETEPPPAETDPLPEEEPEVEPAPGDAGGEEAPGASFAPPGQAKKGDG